ncbi:hypothetical protein DFH07DRAFT_892731 [Mycena maculata]|uniref:Uncharacterized protein n=1 Tax=Mycena maculata TaxID=230809 RepID=A0AAD7MY25_9AGAR|nr:hypothetical protein DFH07DRAFT_892731 [Mycena maculata]
MPSLFKLLGFTLFSTLLAHAVPATPKFPEVIPGAGLPSLESLGLTSAELYMRVPTPLQIKTLEARFNILCGEVPPACSVADAVACSNFLAALGTTACTVNGENVMFCTAGPCNWFGSNISGGPSASSFCSDVATGGNVVINTCQGNGFVDGANAANGNGNLIVTISGES